MSAPANCATQCCPATEIIDVPGIEGEAGDDGIDGINAFTTTTADYVVPAVGATVVVTVLDSRWMTVGQNVFGEGAGTFSVQSKPNSVTATLLYLNYTTNTNSGNNITTGAQFSPGGFEAAGGAGAGSPEGAVSADPGKTYLNTTDDGFWVKKTGSGNTGWIQLVSCLAFLATLCAFGQPIVRNSITTNVQASVTAQLAAPTNGALTTNISVIVPFTPFTNTLMFTNGLLKAVTAP